MHASPPPLIRLFKYCQATPKAPVKSNWSACASDEALKPYVDECRAYYPQYVDRPIQRQFGDNIARMSQPTIVKSRLIGTPTPCCCRSTPRGIGAGTHRTRPPRVWTPGLVAAADIPFSRKAKRIVWRGGTTGAAVGFDNHPRTQLVRRWFKHDPRDIDVGYHEVVQGKSQMEHFVKPGMSLGEQLKSAFIVAPEGNDVASNLKWILWSNSVPVMPPPRYESWLLEGALLPMVHYVPCDPSMADLDRVLAWCRRNPQKCSNIAMQGKEYIAPFLDEQQELNLARRVLDRYLGGPLPDVDKQQPKMRVRRLRNHVRT